MERRVAKMNISSAGGTASSGSRTCKVTLPTSWVEAMGIDGGRRELELTFDGQIITLSRHLDGSEFAAQQLAKGHEVRVLRLYDGDTLCSTIYADFTGQTGDTLCSTIYADFTGQTLAVENQPVPLVKTAFGNNPLPDWKDFQRFLEERCIPRQRAGLREYLEALGLEEYNPLAIIEKTGGRMAEDQQWLTMEVLK